MEKLNPDILYHVAQFLEPCPVLYTRLAMVSKDFYRVFTSDRLWAAFDVYDKRTGIYKHFRESIRGFECTMAFTLRIPSLSSWALPEISGKKYYLFWHHTSYGFYSSNDFNLRETQLILNSFPSAFPLLPDDYRDNAKLALSACRKNILNICDVSERLARDEGFAKKCMQLIPSQLHDSATFPELARFCVHVGPHLEAWLWETAPSFYVRLWFEHQNRGVRMAGRHPSELITNHETAVAALKGNAMYVGHFPEYHNDLQVILASLTPPIICAPIYELLRNHKNGALVAAVLDEHPYLLFAAPYHLRDSEETFHLFLDSIEYITTLNNGKIPCSPQQLLGWVPDSFWADPEVAGRIVDICGGRETLNVPDKFLHIVQQYFSDFEWAKKRVEFRPRMCNFARENLKYPELLNHSVGTMRLFIDASPRLRAENCLHI